MVKFLISAEFWISGLIMINILLLLWSTLLPLTKNDLHRSRQKNPKWSQPEMEKSYIYIKQ